MRFNPTQKNTFTFKFLKRKEAESICYTSRITKNAHSLVLGIWKKSKAVWVIKNYHLGFPWNDIQWISTEEHIRVPYYTTRFANSSVYCKMAILHNIWLNIFCVLLHTINFTSVDVKSSELSRQCLLLDRRHTF